MSAELEEQLALIRGDEPDTSFYEIRFGLAGGPPNQKRYVGVSEIGRAIAEISNHRGAGDVYISAAPRTKRSGKAEAVERVWALRVDCDTPESVERLLTYKPAASLVLETSPGRALGLWGLEKAISPDEAKAHIKALADALGSDPVIHDAPRIIRAASTRNWKHGEPAAVTHLAGTGERYTAEQVVTPATSIADGERNVALTSVAGGLRRTGSDEDEIRADLRLVNKDRCDPPLPDDEVATIAGSVARYEPAQHLTDSGNALRLAEISTGRLLYHHALGWLHYDGKRHRRDQAGRVYQEAKRLVKRMHREAAASELDQKAREVLSKHAFKSESRAGIEAMVALARYAEPLILEDHELLDADPYMLNTQNCIVDLRTGAEIEHSPLAMCSRITAAAYDPDAECPEWERLLAEWLPDEKLRGWLQRLLGYAIHGTHMRVFPILHGYGANGKSSLLDALAAVLGDYAWVGARDLLVEKDEGSAGSESAIAQLFGRRVVLVRETREAKPLDEALVKEVTGDFKLSGKFMKKDRFEFANRASIILATNHLPRIKGGDHGIWSRVRDVPFNVEIPLKDQLKPHEMAELLKLEHNGILRWIVEGAVAFNREGLEPEPDAVLEATRRYRREQDTIGTWFEERCERAPGEVVHRTDAYESYCDYCAGIERKPLARTVFHKRLEERGFRPDERRLGGKSSSKVWSGFKLKDSA